MGFLKKVAIADAVAPYVDRLFMEPAQHVLDKNQSTLTGPSVRGKREPIQTLWERRKAPEYGTRLGPKNMLRFDGNLTIFRIQSGSVLRSTSDNGCHAVQEQLRRFQGNQ